MVKNIPCYNLCWYIVIAKNFDWKKCRKVCLKVSRLPPCFNNLKSPECFVAKRFGNGFGKKKEYGVLIKPQNTLPHDRVPYNRKKAKSSCFWSFSKVKKMLLPNASTFIFKTKKKSQVSITLMKEVQVHVG